MLAKKLPTNLREDSREDRNCVPTQMTISAQNQNSSNYFPFLSFIVRSADKPTPKVISRHITANADNACLNSVEAYSHLQETPFFELTGLATPILLFRRHIEPRGSFRPTENLSALINNSLRG